MDEDIGLDPDHANYSLDAQQISLTRSWMFVDDGEQLSIAQKRSSEWSAEALSSRNATTVFEFPEEQWPRRDPKTCHFNFSFYVYDQLPQNLTSIYEDQLQGWVQSGRRIEENMATEWALLQLFRTSPCRVANATEADLFLVPYMHHAHCALHGGYAFRCGQVPDYEMVELFNSLQHYSPETKNRHVFINVYDAIMSKKQMSSAHLKLTSGPKDGPGSVIVPIFHDDPRYQPSMLLSYNESWWMKPRKYAFVAFFGKRNPRMGQKQPRRFREYFWRSVEGYYPKSIGGLPYISMALDRDRNTTANFYQAYRESVLCPILAGDNCWQRRFFDVIRNGCLPLVLEWPLEGGDRTWHEPNSCSILESYPFMKGVFANDSSIEIDYDSFVIRAPGSLEDESNVTSMLSAMQAILSNPEELVRRQRKMMSYAPLFTFGLGMDAHIFDDAFSRVMRTLERHASDR